MTNLVAIARRLTQAVSAASSHDAPEKAIAEAAKQARAVAGGTQVMGGLGKVVPSMDAMQQDMAALLEYHKTHGIDDPAKWAATFVDMQAQLGVCGGYDEVEADLLPNLYAQVEQMHAYTKGQCPKAALPLAEAIIDTVMKHARATPQQQAQLIKMRSSFRKVAVSGVTGIADTLAMVEAAYRGQRWQFYIDRDKKWIKLGFACPLGETTVVTAAMELGKIRVMAVSIPLRPEQWEPARRALAKRLASGVQVSADYDSATKTAYLEHDVQPVTGDRPTGADAVKAVIMVNGLAELLLSYYVNRPLA